MRSPWGPNRDEQFGGLRASAAEPVRGAGVELGGLADLHDEVEIGEPQPDAAGQHVHPFVALVGPQFGFGLGRREGLGMGRADFVDATAARPEAAYGP